MLLWLNKKPLPFALCLFSPRRCVLNTLMWPVRISLVLLVMLAGFQILNQYVRHQADSFLITADSIKLFLLLIDRCVKLPLQNVVRLGSADLRVI